MLRPIDHSCIFYLIIAKITTSNVEKMYNIDWKGMFVTYGNRIKKKKRKIKKEMKENLERERTFSYSSPRLLFGETIDTASRNEGGEKKKKKNFFRSQSIID